MARYLYSELANLVRARLNCSKDINYHRGQQTETAAWYDRHEKRIEELVKEYLPSGSGFDNGTKIDLDASHGEKLVFTTTFHHMDEYGSYDGWTEHTVIVTPSFGGFNLRVSGRNRNDIKDYIDDEFHACLRTELPQ